MERYVDVKFQVAMDAEQKAAKNLKTVQFKVNLGNISQEVIDKMAVSAQVVRWQGEIRTHWDEFIKGELPGKVEFGSPLFSTSRTRTVTVTKPVTDEDVKKYVDGLSPARKLQQAIELMESNGMEIPDAMLEKLNELTDAEEMAAVAARLAE